MPSTVIPCLRYRDAKSAIAWLVDIFGFTAQAVFQGPDGTIAHAQLTLGDGMVMLSSVSDAGVFSTLVRQPDEYALVETQCPCLTVKDASVLHANAVAAKAEIVMGLEEMPYGGMAFACRDLEGHLWSIGEYDPWVAPEQEAKVLNPYAGCLGGLDPLPVLSSTAEKLNAFACGMTPEVLDAPRAEGKWSSREILAHLADCEVAFSFRLRQVLAGEEVLQPFDQTVWGERYAAYDVPGALALFGAVRGWNLRLLSTVTEADKVRTATHPERGTMTFWTIVETMAGHDINHLRQLEG
jgi:uncharacterized glyoxalase superfamily protein PhnB